MVLLASGIVYALLHVLTKISAANVSEEAIELPMGMLISVGADLPGIIVPWTKQQVPF